MRKALSGKLSCMRTGFVTQCDHFDMEKSILKEIETKKNVTMKR